MKLSALIPLIVITAALTGCGCYVDGPKDGLPACAPTGQQDGQGETSTKIRTGVQATPELAVLMGENSTPATLDYNATQSALNSQIEAANARTFALQSQLVDAQKANDEIGARIAEANERTKQHELDMIREQNAAPIELEAAKLARIEAENKAAELELSRLKLQNAWADNAALLGFALSIVAAMLVFARALSRPHVSYSVAPRPDFSHAQGNTNIWTARECPPGISTEQMVLIAHGRQTTRNKDGAPLTRRNWLHVLTRAQWDGMIDYMLERDYAVQAAENAGVTVTPEGDEYMYQFEQLAPLPHPDAPPTTENTAENPRGQGLEVGRGEVVDDEKDGEQ